MLSIDKASSNLGGTKEMRRERESYLEMEVNEPLGYFMNIYSIQIVK